MVRDGETFEAYLDRLKRERAAREKRKCPIPHYDCEAPGCRWCGKPVESKRKARWHKDCLNEYALHSRRKAQFEHVRKRDGLKCIDCGESPMKWRRGYEVSGGTDRHSNPVGRYTVTAYVTALELEHVVPIWKAAAVEAVADRVWYFGPENLRLRCPACHKLKTAKEAAERAHLNDLATPKPPKAHKRKIPSRPFDKTKRPFRRS